MTALKYESEVSHAEALDEEVEKSPLAKEELTLTNRLLEAFEKPKFSLADYKDHYIENLRELIEAKVQGKELVTPPKAEQPHVINLMDALKKSVAAAQRGDGAEGGGKTRRKAASTAKSQSSGTKRRRKTG
jgi:DNA end-binding protein Ku